jgi:glucosamine--fructose-6-phosphate aminotransferase (isomerizing)
MNESIIEFSPKPYPYWFIKEIMEQSDAALRAISFGGRLLDDNKVRLGGLDSNKYELLQIDNLILLGCGTSYHACLMGAYFFKELCGFNIVLPFDGSEFSHKDIPKLGKTGALFLSQSGETKDLHRCLEVCKEADIYTIGVVNVPDSLIAREVNCGCYLNAGREVSVASTKSYTSQIIVLSLIAIWFSQNKNINNSKRIDMINGLRRLNLDIKNTINNNINVAKIVAEYLAKHPSLFILGKGLCEPACHEGSLKIKEVGYIHAESYSSSALKHGPYSLLTEGFPVILLCPDDEHFNKNISISEEVKSRLAYTIGITDKNLNYHTFEQVLKIESNHYFKGLLSVLPMQLIAYEIALIKGHNPDILRGLAKCVTVD